MAGLPGNSGFFLCMLFGLWMIVDGVFFVIAGIMSVALISIFLLEEKPLQSGVASGSK